MNKVEAFKNELKNYYFYKNELKRLSTIKDKLDALNKDNEDDAPQIDRLLIPFSNWLLEVSNNIEATFTQLTGFKAIRYDVEPSMSNEEASIQMKLALIDKYNNLLNERKKAWEIALNSLDYEISRAKTNLKHIDDVLDKLPVKVRNICIDVYVKGRSYESIVSRGDVYWSVSSLYREVYDALEKALK